MQNKKVDWSNIKHLFLSSTYGWNKCVLIDHEGNILLKAIRDFQEYEIMRHDWEVSFIDKGIKSFEYPIFLIRKKIYDAFWISCFTSIGVLIVLFLLMFRPINDAQRVIAFLCVSPWPIFTFINSIMVLRKWRFITNIKIYENNLFITYFNGKVLKYSISDIVTCCFDKKAHNHFMHFRDGKKLVRLQTLSYAPVFYRIIESMLKQDGNFEEKEFRVRGGQVKCLIENK